MNVALNEMPTAQASPKVGRRFNALWGGALSGLLLLAMFHLALLDVGWWPAIDLATAQLLVFPVLLGLIMRLRLPGLRIPSVVPVLSVFAVLVSTVFAYTYRKVDLSFLVARLGGDQYETATHVFREKLNRELANFSGVSAKRHYETFKTREEVERILTGDASLPAIVWGNTRYVQISVAGRKAIRIGEIASRDLAGEFKNLSLVANVPWLGMSFDPQADTVRFLGHFLSAIVPLHNQFPLPGVSLLTNQELDLRTAGMQISRWRSFAHRSYAWWVLGNWHLKGALNRGTYQSGEMACAERAYQSALRFLRPGDNPELQAAIWNNLGVLLVMRSAFEFTPELKEQGRSQIKFAQSHRRGAKTTFISTVASSNLLKLRTLRSERIQRTGPRKGTILEKKAKRMARKSKRKKALHAKRR